MRPPTTPQAARPEPDEEEDDAGTSRALDPELAAMRGILRTLQKLDEPARARVVRWLGDRFAAEL